MKDVMMLLGFSMGLLTGALLHKYSQGTQELLAQGEKKVVKTAKQIEKKAEQGMDEIEKKVKDGVKAMENKINKTEKKEK